MIDAEIDRTIDPANAHHVPDAVVAGAEESLDAPAGVGQELRKGPRREDLGSLVRR
jgi:hypothetical protein